MITSNLHNHNVHGGPVVFVSTMASESWGGSEELWSRTALHLRSKNIAVHASVMEWPERPRMIHSLLQAGVAIHFRPQVSPKWHRIVDFLRAKSNPWKVSSVEFEWIKKLRPSLVVISQGGPWDGLCWMRACREQGIRHMAIVHSNSESWWPEDSWLPEIRQGYSSADYIFFVCKENKYLFENQCDLDLPRSAIVDNPWNDSGHGIAAWPPDSDGIRLACVGRLDPRAKGQDMAISILSNSPWNTLPIHLTFYGTGPCEQSLRRLAKRYHHGKISFAGHVREPSHIWSRNHALFLPSRHEGLPLVIVEAMRHARMVITTEVAGNTVHIRDGENGFISSAAAIKPLSETLQRAWNEREHWREMGIRAKLDIQNKLNPHPIETFADQLIS